MQQRRHTSSNKGKIGSIHLGTRLAFDKNVRLSSQGHLPRNDRDLGGNCSGLGLTPPMWTSFSSPGPWSKCNLRLRSTYFIVRSRNDLESHTWLKESRHITGTVLYKFVVTSMHQICIYSCLSPFLWVDPSVRGNASRNITWSISSNTTPRLHQPNFHWPRATSRTIPLTWTFVSSSTKSIEVLAYTWVGIGNGWRRPSRERGWYLFYWQTSQVTKNCWMSFTMPSQYTKAAILLCVMQSYGTL